MPVVQLIRSSALSVVVLVFSVSPPVSAQVSVMQGVPSVAELRAALKRDATTPALADTGAPAAQPSARGIVWAAAPTASGSPVAAANAANATATPSPAVALPIGFEVNSARLTVGASAYVEAIAQLMAQDPQLRLTVEGHTDASGQAQRNLMLSWERAMTVFRTLVDRHGIDPARLQPLGRGSLEPLDGTAPTAPANRRVQFRLMS